MAFKFDTIDHTKINFTECPDPQVFRDAAELIANGEEWYCCEALQVACPVTFQNSQEYLFFKHYFLPKVIEGFYSKPWRDGWWGRYILSIW